MTKEEAIKIIDCYDIGFYDLSGEKIPADKLADAFDMAIEALQTPPISQRSMYQAGYKQGREDALQDMKELERLLKENSGLLSRMKERDGNEKLNEICEKSFKKVLTDEKTNKRR